LPHELLRRWDGVHESFRIREHLVKLTVVDVCFSLGLFTYGEPMNLENDSDRDINTLF